MKTTVNLLKIMIGVGLIGAVIIGSNMLFQMLPANNNQTGYPLPDTPTPSVTTECDANTCRSDF